MQKEHSDRGGFVYVKMKSRAERERRNEVKLK